MASFGYAAPLGKFMAWDTIKGLPLAAGKVWTYQAGTSTPVTTWSDQPLTVQNTNPVILDAAGRADIWIADASVMTYKWVVQDKNGVEQYTANGISVPSAGGIVAPPSGGGGTTVVITVPVGAILPFGGPSAPPGTEHDAVDNTQVHPSWLLCDGASYSQGLYQALFGAISTAFGQTGGAGNFNVPDLRGRFPLGKAISGPGSTLGFSGRGGTMAHTHTLPLHQHSIPDHQHTLSTHTHVIPENGYQNGTYGIPPGLVPGTVLVAYSGQPGAVYEATGHILSGGPTPDVTGFQTLSTNVQVAGILTDPQDPPYLPVNYIIKT